MPQASGRADRWQLACYFCTVPRKFLITREGIPVQVHLADPDDFEPADEVVAWRAHAARAKIGLEIFVYPGVGHLYTDPSLPDYDAKASEATWSRVDAFLAPL